MSSVYAGNGGQAPIRSPEYIVGSTLLDAEGLVELVNEIPTIRVIDSRLTTNRSFGYIEGSVSLPNTRTNCTSLAELLPAKSAPVVFHCNGPKCGRSVEALVVAKQCGYSALYWFRGGVEEWRSKGYPLLK